MKLEVLQLTDTYAELDVKGTTPAFLNALRRTLLSQLPKLAIEDVTIYDNTSALFDEMVAHRLGLLPVPTDLNLFVRRNECTCNGEGCPNCTVLYTLSKEGPCTVYSGDLVPAADAKFRIVDPKIPIVKLLEGQRVMLECGAVLGDGMQHAKWQTVTACGYQEYPIVKVGSTNLLPAVAEKLQRTSPAGIVSIENNTIKVIDPIRAVSWLRSVKKVHDLDIEIGYEPDRFVFRLETDGSLHPKVAIRRGISMLMEKLKTVEAELPKLKVPEAIAS